MTSNLFSQKGETVAYGALKAPQKVTDTCNWAGRGYTGDTMGYPKRNNKVLLQIPTWKGVQISFETLQPLQTQALSGP